MYRANPGEESASLVLTRHARERMVNRGLSLTAIRTALEYGRIVYIRCAEIHVIGRKEVAWFDRLGIDLSPYEGVQVVCSSDGAVITAYRNRDFRGLRPRHRRWQACS